MVKSPQKVSPKPRAARRTKGLDRKLLKEIADGMLPDSKPTERLYQGLAESSGFPLQIVKDLFQDVYAQKVVNGDLDGPMPGIIP